jgi:hypothetical protein
MGWDHDWSCDEAVDGALELDNRAEDTTLEAALGELGKEALDRVEPGAGSRLKWKT